MFDLLKAVILGIVEGVTEFLPISSTGHLIIVNRWISFEESFTRMFDVVIQLGAILAVVIYFRKALWPFGKDTDKNAMKWDMWRKVIVAVLPALVLGKLFGDVIEEKLFSPLTVALMLIIGGVVILLVDRKDHGGRIFSIQDMGYRTALGIGLFQCVAMIPGTSRSMATIVGAMLLGATRFLAAEFSFFLAVPTMAAASGYTFLKHGALMSGSEFAVLSVGFVVSFLVAWGVIAVFMKYIQTHDFKVFGIYRLVLGAGVLWFMCR